MTDQYQHHATLEQLRAVVRAQSKTLAYLGNRVEALETYVAAIEPLTARIQAATDCVLRLGIETAKLGHSVEALEATEHTHTPSTRMHSYKVGPAEPIENWGEGHTLVSTEPAATNPQQFTLVMRTAHLLADAFSRSRLGESSLPLARAVLREVAAGVIDWHDSDQLIRTGWEAGKWLEREANR
jgi:hypothetical protein